MSKDTPGPPFPELQFPPDLAIEYVNLARIAHSPIEIVIDLAQMLPGASSAHVQSRVVMSPLGAKLFYQALAENLARYEAAYGAITLPSASSLADQLFHSPPEEPKG